MDPITQLKLSDELSLSKDFDLDSALQGNLVGYVDSDGTLHTGTLKKSTTDAEFARYGAVYAVKEGEKEVLFDRQGNCISPEYGESGFKPVLRNVTATLPVFDTNKVHTRSGGDTATINAIRPIDQFAIAVIQPLLQRLPNPQEMAAADILKWSAVAYQWAQGLFSIASSYRTANDSEVSLNSDNLKEAIDNVVKMLDSVVKSLAVSNDGIKAVVTALNAVTTEIKDKETPKFPDVVAVDNNGSSKFQVDGDWNSGVSYSDMSSAIDSKIKSFAALNNLKTS